MQFAIFLESHLSAEEYASKFPDLETLQGRYHLPPDIAFCLMRPQLNHAVQVCGGGVLRACVCVYLCMQLNACMRVCMCCVCVHLPAAHPFLHAK